MITQERLKEVLHYCPDLGLFWWHPRPVTKPSDRRFNTMCAGKIAGWMNEEGYGRIRIDGASYAISHLAHLFMTGELPMTEMDHVNCRPMDNAWLNLRKATRSQNNANTRGRSRLGLPKGVSPRGRKFWARIRNAAEGRDEYLGIFSTPEEANAAYEARAIELHGQFARAA